MVRRRQYLIARERREKAEEEKVINFPEILKKRTYTEEIKRIMGLALKGNHHADLFEVMMMFKRIKNL
jgi:hypothetical protein